MTTDQIFLFTSVIVALLIWAGRSVMRKIRLENAIKEVIAKRVHQVRIEKHGDMYYWYDDETSQFFAQGRTMQECIAVLKAVHTEEVFLYTTVAKHQYLMVGPDFEPLPLDAATPTEATL